MKRGTEKEKKNPDTVGNRLYEVVPRNLDKTITVPVHPFQALSFIDKITIFGSSHDIVHRNISVIHSLTIHLGGIIIIS